MPTDPYTTPGGIVLPAEALSMTFSRSGGPGGQHANTSDTRVDLVFDLAAAHMSATLRRRLESRLGPIVRVSVATHRSQHMNRAEALRRLGERLDAAARPTKVRRPTRRSLRAQERRLRAKRFRGRNKQLRRRPEADD